VAARAGAQPLDTAQVYIDYDPSALLLVDASGNPAAQVSPGSALSTVLQNQVDAGRGWISFVASSMGETPPAGDVTLATLRLRALKAGVHTVRFSLSDWRSTDLAYNGASVLGDVNAAQISVAAAPYRLLLPLILKP
jgi:hypothetical protein